MKIIPFLRLGEYRMPFGWSARPLFKHNGSLDTESEFPAIYRCEEKRLGETEFVKMLADYRKPEKMNKLTIIPGSINVKILPMEVTLPSKYILQVCCDLNCVSSKLQM